MAVKLSTIFKMELSLFSAYYTHPEIQVDIALILGNLIITVIFDYQILRKPLKILSL